MDTFDPDTADNPFEKRIPVLPEQATERERAVAEKYLRISFVLVPTDGDAFEADATHCWLVVGNQSFCIDKQYQENREHAGVFCWMAAKALCRIIDENQKETP
jgi:hypothetical protein